MNCKVCRVEIEEGEVGQRLSGAAQAHLDSCPACQFFRDERFKLRELIGNLESVNAPADFDFRLRARLAGERNSPRRIGWFPSFAPGAQAIALAAVFVMLVGATAFLREFAAGSGIAPRSENVATLTAVESASPTTFENSFESIETPASTNIHEIRTSINNESFKEGFPSVTDGLKNETGLVAASRAIGKSNLRRHAVSSESAALRALAAEYNIGNARGNVGERLIPLAVNASAQSARVLLDDGRGTSRVVSLEPVTFGAQEMMVERKPLVRLVSSNSRGIW